MSILHYITTVIFVKYKQKAHKDCASLENVLSDFKTTMLDNNNPQNAIIISNNDSWFPISFS